MEEISTSYDDATIRKWAKDIRKMKIRELNVMIKDHKKYFEDANEYGDYEGSYRSIVQGQIDKLEEKVKVLKRK
jgi:predicted methyltransferase